MKINATTGNNTPYKTSYKSKTPQIDSYISSAKYANSAHLSPKRTLLGTFVQSKNENDPHIISLKTRIDNDSTTLKIQFDDRIKLKKPTLKNLQKAEPITQNAFDRILKIIQNITSPVLAELINLFDCDIEKHDLVYKILKNTTILSKTKKGVSDKYIQDFTHRLINAHFDLLKNIVENDIKIYIYDDAMVFNLQPEPKYRHYIGKNSNGFHSVGKIEFFERNAVATLIDKESKNNSTTALSHELAHAFDFNNGKKLNLTHPDITRASGKRIPTYYINLPSFSKEFDEAFNLDFLNMFEIDKKLGKKQGATFEDFFLNPNTKKLLGLFNSPNSTPRLDEYKTRKELFAQLVSFATSDETINTSFGKNAEMLFPNLLLFIRNIFK